MGIYEILTRTFISFLSLFIVTRLLGKKQVSHMTYFNYITGITIGAIAGAFSLDTRIPLLEGLVALVGWTLLTMGMAWITMRWNKGKPLLDGQPTVVIKQGEILETTLRSLRLSMDDLRMMLREKDIFSVRDVDYAILETNGKLSVLKKAEKETPIREDLALSKPTPKFIPTEVIVDGKIIRKNLSELQLSEIWLDRQLKTAGVRSLSEVFYAEVQSDGTLHVDKRNDYVH